MVARPWRPRRLLVRIVQLLLVLATGLPLWSQPETARPAAQTAVGTQAESGTPKVPAFSVISVKRNPTANGWHDASTADGYSATGVALTWLLPEAYGIRQSYRIIGVPDWGDTYRYDIEARVDDADLNALHKLDWKTRYAMVQQILVQRFKIKVHRENRVQPIYSLVVARNDRLPPAADPNSKYANGLVSRSRPGRLTLSNFTMASFAETMSGSLGHMVIDNTGLSGRYDLKLDWNPNETDTSAPDSSAPSIFTAVQEQLGLKLVPTTGSVECLFIDHIEQPSVN
jgi:uncharacterized protein (TIGR03435 family)